MKVKGKAKQLFCMACAFVASFLVTVTALAAVDSDSTNPMFLGTYKCSAISLSKSTIKVYSDSGGDESCDIFAYWDNGKKQFFSGSTDTFTLCEPPTKFNAFYNKVDVVLSNGDQVKQNGVAIGDVDYRATGSVLLTPISIKSNETEFNYVLQK